MSILETERPERLVDDLAPEGLLAAVVAVDHWSERALRAVDYVLSHWTAQFAARQDARSVADLQSTIGNILGRRPPPEPYPHRWRALDDALEARRVTLAARDPERVAQLKHVSKILSHLRYAGPTKQSDLRQQLGLTISPSRLSQIVTLMEAHALVEIERQGRESVLRMPADVGSTPATRPQPVAAAIPGDRTVRGEIGRETLPVIVHAARTGTAGVLDGSYIYSRAGMKTAGPPLSWKQALREEAITRLNQFVTEHHIGQGKKIHLVDLQEQEHRYDFIHGDILKGKILLPLEVIFELDARRTRGIRVIRLGYLSQFSFVYHRDSKLRKELRLPSSRLFDMEQPDWARSLATRHSKIGTLASTAAEYEIYAATQVYRLAPNQMHSMPTVGQLMSWLQRRKESLLAVDVGIAYQITQDPRSKGRFDMSFVQFEERIPAGIAYQTADTAWEAILRESVSRVLNSSDPSVIRDLARTRKLFDDVGISWAPDKDASAA